MLREAIHPLQLASEHLTKYHPLDLSSITNHPSIDAAAVDHIVEGMRTRHFAMIQRQILRLVISDFHTFRQAHGWEPDPENDTALRAYARTLRRPDVIETIWKDMERLHPVLDALTEQTSNAVLEILDHFIEDREELVERQLLCRGDLISDISLGEGDTHAKGRSVAVISLASGNKLVHKPRSLELDEHLPQILAILDPELSHSLTGCVPPSFSRRNHGWQKFMNRRTELEERECESYYYRFGALTAIAGLWGSTDLHHENVIVHGGSPVIIDGETVLQPDVGTLDSPDPRVEELLRSTPLGTLLLPIRDSASVMDVLLSGLGVPWEQTSQETVFQVTHEDSDAFSIQRLQWSIAQEANVPTLAGRPQNPINWYGTLKRGYLDGLAAVRRKEEDLATALRALPGTATVRYVFRATEVYGRFLDSLTHGQQWTSREAEDAVLALLEAPRSASLDPEWFVASEQEQLRHRDIPHFSVGVHDTHATGHVRSPRPMFVTSAVEAAIQRTRRGLEISEDVHLLILETCCSELGRGPDVMTVKDPLFRPLLKHLDPETWQRAMTSVAMRTTNPDGSPDLGWCGGTGLGESTMDSGLSLSFHDMGGPPAFLRRYHLATGLGADDHAAAEHGWRRRAEFVGQTLEELPWSVLGGVASTPLILGATQGIDRILATASSAEDWASAQQLDVAHGSAGLVALLTQLPDSPELRRILMTHAERVRTELRSTDDVLDHNLLHGRLGLWWSILRAGRRLNRPRWVTEARDWLEAAALQPPTHAFRGWCNGLAGVALTSQDADLSASLVDSLVEQMVTIHTDESVDLGVCHGEAGIAQVIARIERRRGLRPRMAREHLRRAFQAGLSQGFHTGTHGHTALLGYALGWSGVADTVLLTSDHGAGLSFPVALEVDHTVVDTPRK